MELAYRKEKSKPVLEMLCTSLQRDSPGLQSNSFKRILVQEYSMGLLGIENRFG